MSTNIFARLRELVPEAPLLVGLVIEHHDDDTSSVRLPIGLGQQVASGSVATGSVIRPRGRTVPVGGWAFVRRGVIETEAPGGEPVQVVIGRITTPVPEPEPPTPVGEVPNNWPTSSFLYADGSYIAGGVNTNKIARSTDHVDYLLYTLPVTGTWNVLSASSTTIIAAATGLDTAARSTDGGLTWAAMPLPAAKPWVDAAFGGSNFVVVSSDGAVALSTNQGVSWTQVAQFAIPPDEDVVSMAYGNGMFIVALTDGTQRRSTTGEVWTTVTASSNNINSIAYEPSVGWIWSTNVEAYITATGDPPINQVFKPEALALGENNTLVAGGGYIWCTTTFDGFGEVALAVDSTGDMYYSGSETYLPSKARLQWVMYPPATPGPDVSTIVGMPAILSPGTPWRMPVASLNLQAYTGGG